MLMNLLLIILIILGIMNLALLGFNKLMSLIRRRNNEKLLLKDDIKSKLLSKISELNTKLRFFESSHISKKEYDELVHKYNILLNQYRSMNNRNKLLQNRIKKLKEKIY
ncbi:hypothetical protein COX58_02265 [archaeon CG_4_10_14_0_2_um_filter_Archaea_38_6]|nr:MAG: hypothetical protein COX58_02265 [archaeon CG_4_10_14_0_2_um_filter_Archaea_38_6]